MGCYRPLGFALPGFAFAQRPGFFFFSPPKKDLPVKAVLYKGVRRVAVEDIEMARVSGPTDALLKITSAATCGSDLPM